MITPTNAQFNLGMTYYYLGEDYVQAYAWWSLLAAQNHKPSKINKNVVKKQMTPAQIREAQKLSSELWEKYVVPFQKD